MKKVHVSVAALLMAGSVLCSSCIGSFALFNTYEKWQCNMTDVKIVNGIVGLILQPIAGSISLFIDAVILNTIEFWSGENPLSAYEQQVQGADGRLYTVKRNAKGYSITAPDGQVTLLTHNTKNDSWSITSGSETRELMRYNEDGTVQATLSDGSTITVANNEAGLQQVRQAVLVEGYFAQR